MKIVSGERSVLPELHRETGEENVVGTWKILLKGIQLVKSKSNKFAPLANQGISKT